MTDESTGTRPHFFIDHTLHGAVKDVADDRGIDVSDAYELAARLLVALGEVDGYQPRPNDDDLAAAFDELLANHPSRDEPT